MEGDGNKRERGERERERERERWTQKIVRWGEYTRRVELRRKDEHRSEEEITRDEV
jgi:hypothetical protein